MGLSQGSARVAIGGLAATRVVLGATAMVAPSLPGRLWVGREAAASVPVGVLARALGARDLALGLGAVLALRHGAPVRGWVEAGGLADAGDLVATLVALPHLPRRSRWVVVAVTAGAAVSARLVAPAAD